MDICFFQLSGPTWILMLEFMRGNGLFPIVGENTREKIKR